MTVKLLTEQHLEFISLKGGCTGSSGSIHVKMPHYHKSPVTAHMLAYVILEVIKYFSGLSLNMQLQLSSGVACPLEFEL